MIIIQYNNIKVNTYIIEYGIKIKIIDISLYS